MFNKSVAKALKRKIGLDESILTKIDARRAEVSLLMNLSRRRIFEHVCNFPCSHLRAISRSTGFSAQNVRWHLRKLMEGSLISESSKGKRKLYSPLKDIINAEECKILALLSGEKMRRVYLFIESSPRSTQSEMCRTFNISQQMLSRVLLSLENSGLIAHEKIGREKAYSVTGKFRGLEKAFELRGKVFEKALMDALEIDGLNPRIKSSDTSDLLIRLDIGGGEQPTLNVFRNPLKALLDGSRREGKTTP